MSTHMTRVLDVAAAVTARGDGRRGFASLKKRGVSHLVPNPRDPRHDDAKIDVSSLDNVLAIDVAARRCVAEPGVTFADLVKATLPLGLLPCMVPELETITLGGAVAGCAVESMAYRHGGFHDGCLEYEVVTGAGDVVRCSRRHDAELFEMMHGSYGTLGILTELTFELVPAKPFVKMEYVTLGSFRELRAATAEAMRADDVDFVDVVAHARDCFVLCLGRFADAADGASSYRGAEIFWRSTRERREDTLTTYDYLFRYDTDCHWTTRTLPGMTTRWGRRLFGGFFLGSTNLLAWTERLRPLFKLQKHPPVVTDLFVPETEVDAFYDWYEQAVGYYPLWIVPYRMRAPYPWLRPERVPCELYFDFAVYGLPNDRPDVVDYSALLERKTFEASGIKTLIGQNHYDERTFWAVYDRVRYERVKRRMDPKNLFRTVYEKMVAPHVAAAPERVALPARVT
jgi:FAD/FMN-containing dehydrogenase